MEIPSTLRCLFTAEVTEHDDEYVLTVPDREVTIGSITPGASYRIAVLDTTQDGDQSASGPAQEQSLPDPPVEEGEIHEVEIEGIGDQGDGIARVDRGYVVIVPDTDMGEVVTVEITDVQQNVSFAEVVDRQTHF